MSIVSSTRALPAKMTDDKQTAYLVIPGAIKNSSWNSETASYDAPTLSGCPPPLPDSTSGESIYCPPGENCEIRLHPLDITPPSSCDPFFENSLTQSKYFLPSLSLVLKNNVNGTQKLVSPQTAFEALGQESEYETTCATSTVECQSGEQSSEIPLSQDGILSAVYTIALYNSYQDTMKKTIFEYVICPYAPTDIFSLPSPCNDPSLVDPSFPSETKEIMGTQPFCLGSVEQPCVCVSLLLHGALKDLGDPSLPGCLETDLYWVGVKLYYTNLEGQMCHNNPVCLNITHAPDSAYAKCYTPYFAKTTSVKTPVPTNVAPPVCSQKSKPLSCPEPLSVTPGESMHGKVYLGCGIQGEMPPPDDVQIVEVSPKVDLSDITRGDCSVYIVLIPNLLTLTE